MHPENSENLHGLETVLRTKQFLTSCKVNIDKTVANSSVCMLQIVLKRHRFIRTSPNPIHTQNALTPSPLSNIVQHV